MRVSLYTLERDGLSISRVEETRWLGADEPSFTGETLPDRAWNERDEPTAKEEREAGNK